MPWRRPGRSSDPRFLLWRRLSVPRIGIAAAANFLACVFSQGRKIGGGPVVSRRAPLAHQPAYKPGSVRFTAETANVTAIPLARRSPGASSNLPERLIRTDPAPEGDYAVPIRSCSRWGLPCRRRCRRRGALLPHRFTLTAGDTRRCPRRSVLCGTVPETGPIKGKSRRTLSGTVGPWSPDFPPRPPFGIGAGRPSGRLTQLGMGAGGGRVKLCRRPW